MAKNKEATIVDGIVSEGKGKPAKVITYTVDEFAEAAEKLLKTTPDVVRAAFLQAGISEATKVDGVSLVKKYLAQSL